MQTYTTRHEAVQAQIIDPIEASGVVKDATAEFDIDAIADAVLDSAGDCYYQTVDVDEFWQIVERHAR